MRPESRFCPAGIARWLLAASAGLLLAGCVTFPELATRSFSGRTLAEEMRIPPEPEVDVSYNVKIDREDPIGTFLSVGTNLAKASQATMARERMAEALRFVDVPEMVRIQAGESCVDGLDFRPAGSRARSDYILDIDILEYGLSVHSSGGVYFAMDARVHLFDTAGGEAVWNRNVHLNEPVSAEVFGVGGLVGDAITVTALAELSEEEMIRGFESLARETGRRIARRLEDDIYRARY